MTAWSVMCILSRVGLFSISNSLATARSHQILETVQVPLSMLLAMLSQVTNSCFIFYTIDWFVLEALRQKASLCRITKIISHFVSLPCGSSIFGKTGIPGINGGSFRVLTTTQLLKTL